jgi:hypothetical protein
MIDFKSSPDIWREITFSLLKSERRTSDVRIFCVSLRDNEFYKLFRKQEHKVARNVAQLVFLTC